MTIGTYVTDVIVSAFESIGYSMAPPKIVKAEDWGVPQRRRRAFFVGSREGIKFTFPENNPKKPKPIREIIEFTLEGAVPINSNIAEKIVYFCESDGHED